MSVKSFEVVVLTNRCKGCGICITMCPKKVLDFSDGFNDYGYSYAYPKNINDCIGCKFCELYCPDFAIYVKPSEQPKQTIIKLKVERKVIEG